MDAAFDSYNLQRLRGADALLLGAKSYRMFMGFWPAQATNPEAGDVHLIVAANALGTGTPAFSAPVDGLTRSSVAGSTTPRTCLSTSCS
jgi:hypothetical protein